MSQHPPLPALPPGWIALWDETAQRYYFVEEATGRTQWELPTVETASQQTRAGEAAGYLPQQQSYAATSPYQQTTATTATADGPGDERGMGKMFTGVAGGALAGTLLGYAAGKLGGGHNHNNHHYRPPPPPLGGFGQFFGGGGGGGGGGGAHGFIGSFLPGGGGGGHHQGGHHQGGGGGYGGWGPFGGGGGGSGHHHGGGNHHGNGHGHGSGGMFGPFGKW